MADEKNSPKRNPSVNLQIQVDDDVAQGIYTNLTVINHNETEFVLDFIYVQPNQPKAKVRARVILGPRHARRFLAAFQRNIDMYEKKHGAIPVPKGQVEDDTLLQ